MNKYGTYIPKAFDLSELNNRIADAQASHSKHFCLYEPQTMFFRSYDQMIRDGYVRDDNHAVLAMPSGSEVWLQVQLIKPKKLVAKELEEISVNVEAEYRAEIKVDQQKALRRMQQRLIAEAQEKAQKEESDRLAALEAQALKEAMEILNISEPVFTKEGV